MEHVKCNYSFGNSSYSSTISNGSLDSQLSSCSRAKVFRFICWWAEKYGWLLSRISKMLTWFGIYYFSATSVLRAWLITGLLIRSFSFEYFTIYFSKAKTSVQIFQLQIMSHGMEIVRVYSTAMALLAKGWKARRLKWVKTRMQKKKECFTAVRVSFIALARSEDT